MIDVERIRADFPGLHQEVHGRPLVYLDNAATAQKPQAVIDALAHAYAYDCANIHRGVHKLSQRATDAYEAARGKVARFVGAARPEECVFVRGTTEAINLVAWSFAQPRLKTGDEIVLTELEHHSNIVPWQLVREATGAVLKVVPVNDAGEVELDAFASTLSDRTRIVSIAHMSNALGTILPVKEMARLAHERGATVIADGAQAAPHVVVDVQDLGVDFYAFSGHKTYGPTGIGALWGRFDLLKKMGPYQGGGEMILTVSFDKTVYQEPPALFEAGTPNIAGAIGLGAAIDYMGELGMNAITAWDDELLAYATGALEQVPGLRIIGTAATKSSVISFVLDGIHPHDVGTIVDREGVAIRTGHHCAQPVMKRFGIPATSRASLAFYNTKEEVDTLVDALHKTREMFAA